MFPLKFKKRRAVCFCGWIRQSTESPWSDLLFMSLLLFSSSVLADPAAQRGNQALNQSLTLHLPPLFFVLFFPTDMTALSIADSLAQGQCAAAGHHLGHHWSEESQRQDVTSVAQHLDRGRTLHVQNRR
uniref:Uncharacterized protein n=1 Tax=Myotis myotis TaxID=51298 RepID=A0A7J7ZY59_MYOMY|nr:hypothetical protein mMyoMyo1_009910 [Myotis myotis]